MVGRMTREEIERKMDELARKIPELFYQERELSSALSRISGESSYWLISELPETNICFRRKLSRSRSKPIPEKVLFSSNRADIGLPRNCAGSVGILYVWRNEAVSGMSPDAGMAARIFVS